MRNKFDRQLQILEEQLIHMGELCESAIANATKALSDGSIEHLQCCEQHWTYFFHTQYSPFSYLCV